MKPFMKAAPRAVIRSSTAGAALLLLAGCAATDPYQREGVWRPTGLPKLNFEAQVARPADLVQGRGTEFAEGDTAAQAVERLRQGKVKPLPTVSTATVGASTGGGT